MKPLHRQTLVERTAEHLREGFRMERWSGKVPGVRTLSTDLGVSRDTIRGSLRLLEQEGFLKACGSGKNRVIQPGRKKKAHRPNLRVGLMRFSSLSKQNSYSQELLLSIKHGVEDAGHALITCTKSIEELGNDVSRMKRTIQDVNADAWIVYSGTREVFDVVTTMEVPVLALGGRSQDLPIACSRTDLAQAMSDAVDVLVERGHRRIVMLSQTLWRKPALNPPIQAFLKRLENHGLKPDLPFNVPDWNESPEGLQNVLRALFFATPPTALLLCEPMQAAPTLVFLAERGLRVPQDVSVVNLLPDPSLAWCRPELAHFDWPLVPHIHRAVRWVEAVALGKADTKTITFPAKFMPAGTIGNQRR
ncbi:MAG: substrate-binding domain-containing protein [Verrucomicrobia bacterium]|nr:substrate-binding domain-containing protein [Verrucomicrobiota bacterium]